MMGNAIAGCAINLPRISRQNALQIKVALVKLEDQLKKGGLSRCVLYSAFLSGLSNHLNIAQSQVVKELTGADCTDFEILSYYVLAQYSPKEIVSILFDAGWNTERIGGAIDTAIEKELQGVSTPLHAMAFMMESKMPDLEVVRIMVGIDCFVHLCVEFLLSCGWNHDRLLFAVIDAEVIDKQVYRTLLMEYGGKRHWDAQSIIRKMVERSISHSSIIKFLRAAGEDDETICLAAGYAGWSDLTLFKAYMDTGTDFRLIIVLMWRFNIDIGVMKKMVELSGLSDEEIVSSLLDEQRWTAGKIICLLVSLGRQPKRIIAILNSGMNREAELREALNQKRHCQEKCSHCRDHFKGGKLAEWRRIFERSIDREAVDRLLF